MKALFLHITQNYSGVEKRFFHYYQYLSTINDNDYTIVCSRTFLSKYKLILSQSSTFKVVKYGFVWNKVSKSKRYIDYLCLLLTLLKLSTTKYDCAHFPTTGSRLFLCFVRATTKSISVVLSEKKLLEKEIGSTFFKNILKKDVQVDCLDYNIKNAIYSKYPHCSKQLHISPCSFISYRGSGKRFEEKEHAVCFCGRLMKEKGIDILIDQIPNILKYTSFKLYILGRGMYASAIRNIKEQYDNNDRIFFDFVLNPIDILEKTIVFLSLQKDENYPSQSLLEAMAAQNVVIATNVGLTNKLVKDDFGFLIADGKELLERLIFIENHRDILPQMAKRAKEFVNTNHRVDIFHQYLMNIYHEKI